MKEIIRELLKEYKDGDNEPLNDGEVNKLVEKIKIYIDLIEGNITQEDFDEIMG